MDAVTDGVTRRIKWNTPELPSAHGTTVGLSVPLYCQWWPKLEYELGYPCSGVNMTEHEGKFENQCHNSESAGFASGLGEG